MNRPCRAPCWPVDGGVPNLVVTAPAGRAERGLADLLLRVRLRPVWLSAGDPDQPGVDRNRRKLEAHACKNPVNFGELPQISCNRAAKW